MKDPKVPIIASGQKEGGMTQEFGIKLLRTSIEGQTEEHIKKLIEGLLNQIAINVLKEALRFQKKWEEETLREKSFFVSDKNGKAH